MQHGSLANGARYRQAHDCQLGGHNLSYGQGIELWRKKEHMRPSDGVKRALWLLFNKLVGLECYFHDLQVDRAQVLTILRREATGGKGPETSFRIAANHSAVWRVQVCGFSFRFLLVFPFLSLFTSLPRLPCHSSLADQVLPGVRTSHPAGRCASILSITTGRRLGVL